MILPVHQRMILVFLSIMVVSVPPVAACDVILVEYYYSASCEPCQAKTEIINHIEHNFSTRVLVIRKEAGSNQTNYDQWRAYGFQYYPSVVINKNIVIYFHDGTSVTRKDGVCVELLKNAIIFKDPITGLHQLIPFYKIIRVIEKPIGGQNDR